MTIYIGENLRIDNNVEHSRQSGEHMRMKSDLALISVWLCPVVTTIFNRGKFGGYPGFSN